MTTITALNVRLGMDVSNFNQGANLARNEVNRVASIMRQSVPSSEKYKKELELIDRAFSATGKKTLEYADAVAFLQKKYETATPAIKASTKAVQDASTASGSMVASLKRMAAAYIGVQTASKALKLATEVEDAQVAFEVLTGSVKDGALLFQQIRDFSERSPITFSGAAQATRTMMSFGVAAQDVRKNLQMLSDVTGGNNERFKMLSLAFSQMSAAGRLMGQDLLQMINAGFNPLQQISKTTGESLLALKERMEEGGISADEVRQAFEAATAEGGMFNGMTERLAETMGGKLNIALSQVEKTLAAAGQAVAPLIISLANGFEDIQPVLQAVVNILVGIVDGLRTMIALWNDFFNQDADLTALNKLLDELEKRDRDRANAAFNQANQEFEKKKEAAAAVAEVDKKAMEKAQKAQEKAIKEWQASRKKAIEKAHKERLKAIEKERKAQEDAERAFRRELENARREAIRFFEERARQTKKMREDVAAGPGTGIEAGTSEAARFFADAINAQIGAAAVPDEFVSQRDIAKHTAEMVKFLRDAKAAQDRQIELAAQQLAETQQNGFRRLR